MRVKMSDHPSSGDAVMRALASVQQDLDRVQAENIHLKEEQVKLQAGREDRI